MQSIERGFLQVWNRDAHGIQSIHSISGARYRIEPVQIDAQKGFRVLRNGTEIVGPNAGLHAPHWFITEGAAKDYAADYAWNTEE